MNENNELAYVHVYCTCTCTKVLTSTVDKRRSDVSHKDCTTDG